MKKVISAVLSAGVLLMVGCQPNAGNTNANLANSNVNPANTFSSNTNTNVNVSNVNSTSTISETKEPDQYQATVQLKLEATGTSSNTTTLPALSAVVARNGADRRMEFVMPNGDKVVYLDKDGVTQVMLPNRKQYATLDKDSMGFDVRQLMMPEQIVNQVKTVKGVERVGEENNNGRQVIKYRYGSTTNTQTQAGQVATESFFLIDKETGLPIHSETVSQSQNGNVQGFNGLRVVTEMSNIKTETTPDLFTVPTDYAKVDSAQVKSQVQVIFNIVGSLLSQALKTNQPNASTNTNTNMATPMTSPTAATK